ncbi:MAG: hypothetical protein KGO02_20950 [Alphaproteobacteria bacterium]|nr:hypothetical protein [Alphaproteobacteria bacterium]
MATSILHSAPNGAKMIVAELRDGNGNLAAPLMYTVTGPHTPAPLYSGPSKDEADEAFEVARQAKRPKA